MLVSPVSAKEVFLAQTSFSFPYDASMANTMAASRYVNNTVLAPGEVFSFNQTVGERTISRGFVRGGIVSRVGDKPVFTTGMGGGICRLSTALYQTAKKANMQILERHSHSLEVPYAKQGNDAAVSWGIWDMRFKNTSKYPIKINANCTRTRLTTSIYEIRPDKVATKVYFDDQQFDGMKDEESGITYIPIADIAKSKGMQVDWDGAKKQVRIMNGTKEVFYYVLGQDSMIINGVKYPSKTIVWQGRTIVPLETADIIFAR